MHSYLFIIVSKLSTITRGQTFLISREYIVWIEARGTPRIQLCLSRKEAPMTELRSFKSAERGVQMYVLKWIKKKQLILVASVISALTAAA